MTPERYQQVGQLYRAALEMEVDQRAAFLAEACGGDEALRQEVESLLGYEARSGGIIDQPALEVAARELAGQPLSGAQHMAPANMAPRQIGAYQLLEPLGRGGMGEVHLALDRRLNRKVAVKLLPAEFTTDDSRVRRFQQEAEAVSALNHPNIITIHEIGEASTETGTTHYIVTEYVEGETLRRRMASAPKQQLSPSEAIDIAVQIAAALSAAHGARIMHRDIKPENVMARRDGIVKVLDFGLAKLAELASPIIDSQASMGARQSTDGGVVMGTPRYMSPEQARGERVDARTDIFSLGVMLYEMVAGRPPFAGATPNETIAAILRDSPPPLAGFVPDAPPELERIIGKALQKNREERYQNASELLTELKQLSRDREFLSGEKKRSGRAKAEGGARNKRRLAAIVALIGVIVTAVAWFYVNHPPVLTSLDTILLADFENRTGDKIFDGMLKHSLAIELQQSRFLNLFPEPRLRQTLRLMERSPTERVTSETARELCERHNLKAFIAGSIALLGSQYVITLEALEGQSGESLARVQATAEGREQVLSALSQAAASLRENLGESLSSIQWFAKPLKQVTTPKLEAFKAWTLGLEQSYKGNMVNAIPFYKQAVAIDPNLGNAYSVLATIYGNTNRPELAAKYAEIGYKHRDHVSDYERLRIDNFYHAFVTRDLIKRIEVLQITKGRYPRDPGAPTDLALTYYLIGQYEQAVAEAREAIRLDPTFAPAHKALGLALLPLGHSAELRVALTQAIQMRLDTPDFHTVLYQIAFIEDDTAEMQKQIEWPRGKRDEYLAFDWQTGAAAFAGQWRKAQTLSRRAIDLAGSDDTIELAARYATEQALRSALFRDCRRAGADAAQGLKLSRGRASLPRAALALALCGQTAHAKSSIHEMTQLYPEDTLINSIWLPVIRAAIELQRRDAGNGATQAIVQLRPASRYESAAEFWPQYLRGQAYLTLGQGREAATEFKTILDHRGYAPLSVLYPLAHVGLARASWLMGDTTGRRKAYQDFLALWKNADPDLPILIEAKKEYER